MDKAKRYDQVKEIVSMYFDGAITDTEALQKICLLVASEESHD